MSIEHILIGKHHGGSDCWRTPSLLFRNLHREFSFSMDGAATKHDTLLPRFTDDISRQSWDGEKVFCNPPYSDIPSFLLKSSESDLAVFLIPYRPHTTYRQGKPIKCIADALRMPLSTSYRIAQRLS